MLPWLVLFTHYNNGYSDLNLMFLYQLYFNEIIYKQVFSVCIATLQIKDLQLSKQINKYWNGGFRQKKRACETRTVLLRLWTKKGK